MNDSLNKQILLWQKILEFRKNNLILKKDQTNPFHHSKYADINGLLDLINNDLNALGLVPFQRVVLKDDISHTFLETIIIDSETGESTPSSFYPLLIDEKGKSPMQALGSASTYARRYGLITALGIKQEDDDGNFGLQKKESISQSLNPDKYYKFAVKKVEKANGKFGEYLKIWTNTEIGEATFSLGMSATRKRQDFAKCLGIDTPELYSDSLPLLSGEGEATISRRVFKGKTYFSLNALKAKNSIENDIPF